MAVFVCERCGAQVETRCKPKKCPQCAENGTMAKAETGDPKGKAKGQ